VECAAFLLERGADVNGADNDGNTPLHEAVYRECLAMQALLQARGADLDAQNVVRALGGLRRCARRAAASADRAD